MLVSLSREQHHYYFGSTQCAHYWTIEIIHGHISLFYTLC